MYKCGCREKSFKSDWALQKHIKTVHLNLKEYRCSICSDELKSKFALDIHVKRKHGVGKDFKCEVCGKSFVIVLDLKQHLARHSPRERIPCKKCGKEFFTEYMRMHKKVNCALSYPCNYCSKSFNTKVGLNNHLGQVHNKVQDHPLDTDKQCVICGKSLGGLKKIAILCGKRCKEIRANQQALERREKRRQAGKNCLVCGEHFINHNINNLMCSDDCRKERLRILRNFSDKIASAKERAAVYMNTERGKRLHRLRAAKSRGKKALFELVSTIERIKNE